MAFVHRGESGKMVLADGPEVDAIMVAANEFEQLPVDFLEDVFEVTAKNALTESGDEKQAPLVKAGDNFAALCQDYITVHARYDRAAEVGLWNLAELLFKPNDMDQSLYDWDRERSYQLDLWLCKMLEFEQPVTLWDYVTQGKVDMLVESPEFSRFTVVLFLQLSNDIVVRKKAQKQIAHWRERQQLELIEENELKVYMALGLQVRYLGAELEPISESVQRLLKDSEDGHFTLPSKEVAWELIRFGCHEQNRALDVTVRATIPSRRVSNYYLGWHLWTVVRTSGDWRMKRSYEDELTVDYAEQLASYGALHLAVFVLCHITDSASRESAVRSLLERNAMRLNERIVGRLCRYVNIPSTWIHSALALQAKQKGRSASYFEHLVHAEEWIDAEHVYTEKLAPMAIELDDYNALRRFTSLLLSNKTPQKAHIPVTSLYSEYCRLYELISSHGAARTPEVEQLCDSIDARLDNEEQLSPLQSSARSMIGLTMMRLRRRIGAQPWVDGGELGKRCYRLGISIIDMAMCDRGGPSIL
ncbi:unnamed protein product, partial [Mesorhabditis spiculigera]